MEQSVIDQKSAAIDRKKRLLKKLLNEIKKEEQFLDEKQDELWIEKKIKPIEILTDSPDDSEKTKEDKK